MVHSKADYDGAMEASQILFDKGTTESLRKMDEKTFLSVFEGVPAYDLKEELIEQGITVTDLCSVQTTIFQSKGELRRLVQGGGLNINKEKVEDADMVVGTNHLLNNKYILVQKGKKNYYLIRLV